MKLTTEGNIAFFTPFKMVVTWRHSSHIGEQKNEMAAMLLHVRIKLFSNVKNFLCCVKKNSGNLVRDITLGSIELHIQFELRISDYAVTQKYLECCNPNFRDENFRFPDSELHNIFFLENLDFHLVIRKRYHKLTRHSLEVLFRV